MPTLSLPENRIDVWTANPDNFGDSEDVQIFLDSFDELELSRYRRLRFARHKKLFATAHWLVRHVLSLYHATDAHQWRFRVNSYGRPAIDNHELSGQLKFNLSHTHGLAVCALTVAHAIGVDVENADRSVDLRVAHRYFSSKETEQLMQLPPLQRPHRFLQLWTLKEAYIKARGLGLAIPLHGFSFSALAEKQPAISFDATVDDDPIAWSFQQYELPSNHLLALACKKPPADVLAINVYEVNSVSAPQAHAKS